MGIRTQGRVRQNARYSILNGSFSVVAMGTVGTYLPVYLIDGLHATNQAIALSNALPALLGAVAMAVGAVLLTRLQRYKELSVAATILSRLMYACLSLAPSFGVNGALVAIYANSASNFMQGVGGLAWQALIDRLIPSRLRASYFSQRNLITTVVALVATLILGLALSQFSTHALPGYQAIFVLAALAGLGETYWLWRHQEPITKTPFVLPQDVAWKSVLSAKRFLAFIAASAFFNLGWQMAWPLYSIYQIRLAHATSLWVGLFTIAGQLGQIIAFRWWGRISIRRGNLIPLALAGIGLASSPLLTILSRALPWLVFTNFESGIFVAGANLLLFNQLLHASPKGHRATYIAAYNIVLGFVGFVAPELGIWLLAWIHMTATMLVATAWRLVGGLIFLWGTGILPSSPWISNHWIYRVRRHWFTGQHH